MKIKGKSKQIQISKYTIVIWTCYWFFWLNVREICNKYIEKKYFKNTFSLAIAESQQI